MWLRSPDPTIPRGEYEPDKVHPWEQEFLRQEEFCEEHDWDKIMQVLQESQGFVFEKEEWVKAEPHSQRNWEGDGA